MPNYEVHYLSVSDADAIIIRYENSGDQYVVLIDAGNVSDSDKIKNYIWNHWKTYTIDLAICTHPCLLYTSQGLMILFFPFIAYI